MIFSHDYYYPPTKEGEKSTVLCMRCAFRIKGADITSESAKENYKEKPMKWVNDNGVRGEGVVILCPQCIDLEIGAEYMPLIHRQIMKALEYESKWAKLPMPTDLKNMKIMNQEAT